ncbi:hypothetical protein FRC03_005326 [Tulasnella sp. 419]|nr:hypothetical protein FRC03_005326 [Tulasnella sp. 419]
MTFLNAFRNIKASSAFAYSKKKKDATSSDGSNMLSQLETWHKLTQTAKDSIIGDSTSLVSLELYVMCIEPSDVEPTVKTLMEILPHQVALRVFVRPIMLKEKVPRGRQEIESLDRNVVMEAEFKRLIELYREKEGGSKE